MKRTTTTHTPSIAVFTLTALMGAGTPTASAEFLGVTFDSIPDGPFGTRTCRAMAEFSDPGDELLAVVGTPDTLLRFKSTAGWVLNFDESVAGIAAADLPFHDTWEYDSWVTIGDVGVEQQEIVFTPGFALCGSSSPHQLRWCESFVRNNDGWFVVPSGRTVGEMDPKGTPDTGWRVPIAQFTTKDVGNVAFCGEVIWLNAGGKNLRAPFDASCRTEITIDANRRTTSLAILPVGDGHDGEEGWQVTGMVTTVAIGQDVDADLSEVVTIQRAGEPIGMFPRDVTYESIDVCTSTLR